MSISIITGLHAPGNQFIGAAYQSLQEQTIQEWEWVILENNGGKVPNHIKADPRVRVKRADYITGIGRIKHVLCGFARGEIIVELDADDLLLPTALEKIQAMISMGADFCYSNCCEFQEGTWRSNIFGAHFGWRSRVFRYQGHELIEMISPPAIAPNLRFVWWSPNHVRAWTRDAYWEIGGHDVNRPICDDHDLLIRFYLAGKKMVHIDECLYLARFTGANTQALQNAAIQETTWRIYHERIWELSAKWMRDGGSPPAPGPFGYGKVTYADELTPAMPVALEPTKQLTIVTPCSRPQNLEKIAPALEEARQEFDLTWLVVHDCGSGPCEMPEVGARILHAPVPGSMAGHGQMNAALDSITAGLVWRCDDDNLPVPGFFRRLRQEVKENSGMPVFLFAQKRDGFKVAMNGQVAPPVPIVRQVDSAQVVYRIEAARHARLQVGRYEADGLFIQALCQNVPWKPIAEPLTDYNALTRN